MAGREIAGGRVAQSLASQRLCGFSAKSACRRPLIAMLELTLTPGKTSETARGAGGWTMASPTAARGHASHPRERGGPVFTHAPAPGADGHGKKLPHRFFNRQSAIDNPVGSAPFPLPPVWAWTSANLQSGRCSGHQARDAPIVMVAAATWAFGTTPVASVVVCRIVICPVTPFLLFCPVSRGHPALRDHRGRRKCWPEAELGGEAGVDGKVSESSVGKAALSGCRGPNDRENGCLPRSLRGSAPKIRRAIAF
jgi:hypothetical protein